MDRALVRPVLVGGEAIAEGWVPGLTVALQLRPRVVLGAQGTVGPIDFLEEVTPAVLLYGLLEHGLHRLATAARELPERGMCGGVDADGRRRRLWIPVHTN